MSVKKIVVFRSAALGDFILALPAFRLLRNEYPEAEILLITTQSRHKSIRDSVANYSPTSPIPWVEFAMPHLIDDVILVEGTPTFGYLMALRQKTRRIDVERIFLFLDSGAPWPGRLKKIALLFFLFGFRPIFGWRAKGSFNGNRKKLKKEGLLPHHVFGPMQFLRELYPGRRLNDEDVSFDLSTSADSQEWVQRLWQEHSLGSKVVIAIAAGSIQPHKRWPLMKYIEVCQALLKEDPIRKFLLVGTPSDRALAEPFVLALRESSIDLVGKTSIAQLAAVFNRCTLVLGNDGGAMHLGDAVGSKVVSIVPGIEYSDSIEPWNNRQYAVRHTVDCAPCYSFMRCPLGHNRCMTELSVASVLESCRRQLHR